VNKEHPNRNFFRRFNPLSINPLGDEVIITHVRDAMLFEGEQMEIDAIEAWCTIDGKIKEAWDLPVVHTAKIADSQ
jgi:hypothetical protein